MLKLIENGKANAVHFTLLKYKIAKNSTLEGAFVFQVNELKLTQHELFYLFQFKSAAVYIYELFCVAL